MTLEEMIVKYDEMMYIYFVFLKQDEYYTGYICVTENTHNKSLSGKTVTHVDINEIYFESVVKVSIDDAYNEIYEELLKLYEEFGGYTEKHRLQDDMSYMGNYTVSPYHAVVLSKKQYEKLLTLYEKEITVIQKMTDEFYETNDTKIITARLNYANGAVRRDDVNNIFYFRDGNMQENGNVLIAISVKTPYPIDEFLNECKEFYFGMRGTYINQWVVRSYESALAFPDDFYVDGYKVFSSRKKNTVLKPKSKLDLVTLDLNVNKEL